MIRIKAVISYDGTNFHGWQSQKIIGRTIQSTIEDVLSKVFDEKITVFGAGRTDAGVHAKGQVIHFDINKPQSFMQRISLVDAINQRLPKDISFMSAEVVDDNFHSRKSAVGKKYVYTIVNSNVMHPIMRRFAYKFSKKLDIEKLLHISKVFIGTHDFKAFANKNNEGIARYSSVRSIFNINIIKNDDVILFEITGDGFLYKMIRNIIGTILYYATGKLSESDIIDAMTLLDRNKIGPAAPAWGLCLESVYY